MEDFNYIVISDDNADNEDQVIHLDDFYTNCTLCYYVMPLLIDSTVTYEYVKDTKLDDINNTFYEVNYI